VIQIANGLVSTFVKHERNPVLFPAGKVPATSVTFGPNPGSGRTRRGSGRRRVDRRLLEKEFSGFIFRGTDVARAIQTVRRSKGSAGRRGSQSRWKGNAARIQIALHRG